ncbi:unnamed protein product [Effrenium voratum]|uniref:Glucosidase II subunit alpha n=1 Tax=Effrenium voratum TaxID=2562239 RepID=A0AA36N160_9DINO|nr:unnamed protein product [Effrenium voratum]CAJ1430093.1 unnamed protein product [Effrenium voratum]
MVMAMAMAVAVGLLALCAAVDRSKFRTCEQTGFCRRYRAYVQEVLQRPVQGHFVDVSTLAHEGHEVSVLLRQPGRHDPLRLELRFFQTAGGCGVVRVTISAVLGARFRVREGDVAMAPGGGLWPDTVEVQQHEGSTELSSGPCSALLRHSPLALELRRGRWLQRLNARRLLSLERPRTKGAEGSAEGGAQAEKAARPLDATDMDTELWEEAFDGFVDSKPRGPTAVAFDASFAAATLSGLAEHSARLRLEEAAGGFGSEPFRLYNLDVFEHDVDVPMALYGSIPFVTAVHADDSAGASAVASGLLVVNPSEGFVRVERKNAADAETWWAFEAGVLDLFAFLGPSPEEVLRQYHAVTGWPRLPLLAVLGKHQSRWNYVTPQDVLEVSAGFDQHTIPLDFIWLDLEHTHGKRYFTWDPKHFPAEAVKQMLETLNRSHRKLVTIVDPHLLAEENFSVAAVFRQRRLLVAKPSPDAADADDAEAFVGFCWPGPSLYPDFCDPQAREAWAELFDFQAYPGYKAELFTWNDMNEPSVFDGPEVTLPKDTKHRCGQDEPVEHREVHNLYGFYVQEASVLGQLRRDPQTRPFVLTRSFFAGSHRHGAAWTGDNMANWRHLERSVAMLLSLALCGMSLAGADVAGFMGDPDVELFVRWHQLGIWYPFYRAHAHLTSKRREPWLFEPQVTELVRQAVVARYRLLPMWYTLAAEWALLGSPMIRPIWYKDLGDQQAYEHADTHFFVGEALLVRAPAEHAKALTVYLPGTGSKWFDFWHLTRAPKVGGEAFKEPLQKQHLPVFARAGHCLAQRWRPRRSTGAMWRDPHTIVCYLDDSAGGFAQGRVYLDDGRSHEYQGGAFVFDELRFEHGSLRGAPRRGGLPGLPGPAAALAAPALPDSALRVERLVLVGLDARNLRVRSSAKEALEFHAEPIANSTLSVVTVKEPGVRLGTEWSVDFR